MLTKILLVSLLIFGASAVRAETAGNGAAETCDRLAGDPGDPDLPRGIPGVEFFLIDMEKAIPACRAALAGLTVGDDLSASGMQEGPSWFGQGPNVLERRIRYQLARALHIASVDEARPFYETAAAAGSSNAILMRCLIDEDSKGAMPETTAARRCYEAGAAAGNAEAMRLLGVLHEEAKDPARDLAAARGWYEKAAAAGSSVAMRTLAKRYAEGEGVAKDGAVARTWLEKAAEAGDIEAMEKLAGQYEDGTDVTADPAAARRWYEKAAAFGNTSAMHSLALMSIFGKDGPQDYRTARFWYEKGAAAGDSFLMDELGALYDAGAGVAPDRETARAWFEKAAANGYEKAAATLAVLTNAGSPFGGVVLTRKADAGEAYGAPGPRTCSSRSLSPTGPGGASRAAAYVVCQTEYDWGNRLTLVSNVRLTVGPSRPHDPAKDTTPDDIVTSVPVHEISGSLTHYDCEKRDGKTGSMNCRRREWPNVKGFCYFHTSNEWTCSIGYDTTGPYVALNNSGPPRAED